MKLLPADVYTAFNATILSENDKLVIINLYEPIIGSQAVSLYLTLWCDLERINVDNPHHTHHHLMTILKSRLDDILLARKSLEAVGLLKTYLKENDNINEYIYELYSPLSAYEFFNHPILNVLLLNNIGDREYNEIKKHYKRSTINKSEYQEITSSMNETFKSVNSIEGINEEIVKENKIGVNLDNLIDFDLIEASIPKSILNNKAFNKKTKELINQLAFVYNLDSLKMSNIIIASLDSVGLIDKEKLRTNVRNNYQYNNNGVLPTLIYRTQPSYLKTPSGDTSTNGKIIYAFENTRPYDFLKIKNKNVEPTPRDLHLIEHLAVDFHLPSGVINVLIDYVLKVNKGSLNKNYVETIASVLSRKGIKTVPDAMETLRRNKKASKLPVKNISVTPAWMGESITEEAMTQEEIDELESMFKEFR